MFYGVRYTKALQDILNTKGGQLAREMVQLSVPGLSGKIEVFSQRNGNWSKSGLTPQDAAVTSVALFGMELAHNGETSNQRLAGSTLQMALVDYAKGNPTAEVACKAVLTKWLADRPHEHQPATPVPTVTPESGTTAAIEALGLQTLADSAASFMVMQAQWIRTMKNRPEFDDRTAAAFAYGVWDSITQHMNLTNGDFVQTLANFAARWLDTQDEKSISAIANTMLRLRDDPAYQSSVIAGGQAFRAWTEPKGDFFPVHLAQCMTANAKRTRSGR